MTRDPPQVALYAHRLGQLTPSGVDRYISELARALFHLHQDRYHLIATSEKWQPSWIPHELEVRRVAGPRRVVQLMWTLLGLPRIDRFTRGADLLHVMVPTWPVPSRMPIVYTFHDVMPLERPDWFSRKEVFLFRAAARDAAARATRIIAVSNTVAAGVVRTLGIDRNRISVIYQGIAERFRVRPPGPAIASVCSRFNVESGKFLLYVGRIEERKNLNTVLRALARARSDAPLVIAGSAGRGADRVLAEIERLNLSSRVRITGFVPDRDLPALMSGALALLHPSDFEGFGLTPVEAMALGVPAIVSRGGALPEVLGDAATFVAGHDEEEWAAAVVRMQEDGAFAAAMAAKGRRHTERYTWDRTARDTAELHEALWSP